jgi:CHAT domain-containing protein
MDKKYPLLRIFFYLFMLTGCFLSSASMGRSMSDFNVPEQFIADNESQEDNVSESESLHELNNILKAYLERGDLDNSRRVVERIIKKIRDLKKNETFSETYYFVGIYYLISKNYGEAIRFLELSAELKENRKEYDERYAKILYNLGVAYNGMGDFSNQEHYSVNSLDIEKKIFGESSPLLIKTYSSLIIAYIGLQEYDKSLEFSKIALNIAVSNPGSADWEDLVALYNNLGVLYMRLADYSKAKVFLEKSESIYHHNKQGINENYFSLLNSLAITYGFLGLPAKSNEYYEKGIKLALSHNSSLAYNYINSYAIILGQSGNNKRGEALLRDAMVRAKVKFGEDSPGYISVLFNYAEYLREFKIDNNKALEYYKQCLDYFGNNNRNLFLKDPLYLGYSSSLADNGDNNKALDIIQSLLFPDNRNELDNGNKAGLYENPSIESIKADKISLKLLRLKYQILWKYYNKTEDQNMLKTASSTSKLIVRLLEKLRINISEEDSRLILGDRYRDSYLNAIRDFNLLYRKTDDHVFLEEAFEFSEKSKVAGLLTATRELKASQFNIPSDLSELEKKLKRDISLLSARISDELKSEHADTFLINIWKENILKSSVMRDSLIAVFEEKYPGYYSFKYNTKVTKLDEIPGIIGRNGNYITYIASDTLLYIFVANREKQELLAFPIDSSFYSDIKQFRNLLSMPSPSANARNAFEDFQKTGYRLYRKIIEPIRPYLISKKLLISPDNILSYIPFETIPTSPFSGERLLYNKVPYLMNEFDISYTYSVTFMSESMKRVSHPGNKLIAFAPSYNEPIDIKSVLMNRQSVDGMLPDLPYARQEAEYVSSVTGGKLYENEEAKETVYKTESGKYDIIHLAMHTILNDKDPMYSTLIFSSENDTTEDRYLNTYEVYSIPLRAKMVVLSSCNSGTGYLYSGEGILSLARGFMYSGSESVVMAMWEIEDKSGTEIVKKFYDNLKKGYSKSSALRRARITYLKEADQLRSHPYFWSALVVYGNNSPLFYSKYIVFISVITGIIIATFLGIYFRRRKYS